MKYDLIVVGAAAEDCLRVVLVERKRNITGLIGLVPRYSISANCVPVRQGYMEMDTLNLFL